MLEVWSDGRALILLPTCLYPAVDLVFAWPTIFTIYTCKSFGAAA